MKLFTNYFLLSALLILFSSSLWGEQNSEQNLTDSDVSSIETDKWMGEMWGYISNRTLNEISLPGSHDSGMNVDDIVLNPIGCRAANVANTGTQSKNIEGQLNEGSRYFDIRPAVIDPSKYNGTRWITAHVGVVADSTLGCEGESLKSIREGLHNFFLDSEHESELVILKISHCGEEPAFFSSGYSCSDTELKHIASSLDIDGRLIKFAKSDSFTLKTISLKELIDKGNVLLLVDGVSEPEKGIFSVGHECNDDYYLYDKYANKNNYPDMKTDQHTKLTTDASHTMTCDGTDYKRNFLLSWTLTLSEAEAIAGVPAILVIAPNATLKLEADIKAWVSSGDITKKYFPNIIYIDAVGSQATRSAIYINLHYENLLDN